MTLTRPAIVVTVPTLEQQAAGLGQRYSKTSAEREAIARDAWGLLLAYEAQGGSHSLRWLEQHAGLSHSTASNLRDAGRALKMGAQPGQGVSQLAIVGRWLRKGKSLAEAQQIADDSAARKAAADAAGIGVASVKYPSHEAGSMAAAYTDTVQTLNAEGLPVPELPELTATLVQIGAQHATPEVLREVMTGSRQPEKVKSDIHLPALTFYDWLARQPCAVCQMPGELRVELHHVRTFDIGDQVGGRRFKHDQGKELLLPLCPRHHRTAQDAAHAEGQDAWSTRHFGRPDAVYVLAARYLSSWAGENQLLRGKTW